MKKTDIKKQLGAIVKELEVKPHYSSIAKYPLSITKVDAESLSKCLAAYDMKAKGLSNVEIGGVFYECTQAEIDYYKADARRDYNFYFDERMQERYAKKTRKNFIAIKEATEKVRARLKRQRKEGVSSEEVDELVDKELGILTRKDDDRRSLKNYFNVSASRMLAKAAANIAAVEKGNFPVGHLKSK